MKEYNVRILPDCKLIVRSFEREPEKVVHVIVRNVFLTTRTFFVKIHSFHETKLQQIDWVDSHVKEVYEGY